MPEVSEKAVEAAARSLNPDAFKKGIGLGHQAFIEEDAEDRREVREVAREVLTAALPHLTLDEPLREALAAIEEHQRTVSRYCNKCGYMGPLEIHPGCSYAASMNVRDYELYDTASRIRTQLEGEQ